MKRSVVMTALVLGSGNLAAQPIGTARTGPVIMDFGPVYDVAHVGFATPAGPLRVVFDVAEAPDDPAAVNSRIETVARFLNMHARVGVRPSMMRLAVVLHGESGKYALQSDAYRARFGVDNPHLALLRQLHDAGVRIVLCGQTAMHRGFPAEHLLPSVDVALSAMTALVALQADGYALISF